ncbi:MAG: hypothetical protein LQ340_002234 [Diploschistes diacapsis]|nr:MAG: hypothetical protein LQ340_002234 [Diploschistes diacapsis]
MSSQEERLRALLEATERQLAEAKQQVAEEQKRAAEEQQRAAERATVAEEQQRIAEEQQRIAEKRTQKTTLAECLELCHLHLQAAFTVETNPNWTTKGGTTSPKNKFYPKNLRLWEGLPETLHGLFEKAYQYFHPDGQSGQRCFKSTQYLQELGEDLNRNRLADEQALRFYEQIAVENIVTSIINNLSQTPEAQTQFGLNKSIKFENGPNSLSDAAEEVLEALSIRTPRNSPPPSSSSIEPSSEPKPSTRPDRFCVYSENGETEENRQLLLTVEYKPPHKLSIGNLKAGFRDMNLKEEIINRATIPTYKEDTESMTDEDRRGKAEKLQYNADKLVAAVSTQVFHDMIEYGLEYSYLTTGEAFVFFHVRSEDPETLYYHLAIPSEDVEDKDLDVLLSQTAIGIVLSLCLLAFQSTSRSQNWRRDAKRKLERYKVDYEAVLRSIPKSERKETPNFAYRGPKGRPIDRSPYLTRERIKNMGCKPSHPSNPNPTEKDDDDDPDTPSKPRRSTRNQRGPGMRTSTAASDRRTGQKQRSDQNSKTEKPKKQRPYCTQDCALGIIHGTAVDRCCPNVDLHPSLNGRHLVNADMLKELVRAQLAVDPDCGCKPLGLQGARGALFRIMLMSHGYVLVAKATVRAFAPCLLHEANVYEHLKGLQGYAIPACLGYIKLKRRYYLDLGVKITHMLLMAWGGTILDDTVDLDLQVDRTVKEVREAGVEQHDIRSPNLLWNSERQRVMLIDFERATYIFKKPILNVRSRTVFEELSPNKKRKLLNQENGVLKKAQGESCLEWTN